MVKCKQDPRQLWNDFEDWNVSILVDVALLGQIEDLRLVKLQANVPGDQDLDEIICADVP